MLTIRSRLTVAHDSKYSVRGREAREEVQMEYTQEQLRDLIAEARRRENVMSRQAAERICKVQGGTVEERMAQFEAARIK